ncbi:MAG TPA: hypothetical protein VMF70_06835 [Gemmatimonadales bacterium]|nr:hypothetical protein [Gemmatimonadales bacterium]
MGSAGERPDLDALRELEEVLHHLADELGAWRRRALTAEARLAELARLQEGGGTALLRLRELEEENTGLERRLGSARTQLSELVGRLGFLEQQAVVGARTEVAKS